MTPAQKRLKELRERQSKERQRMAELGMADSLNDETRSELDTIEKGTPDLERQIRAAQTAVDQEEAEQKTEQRAAFPDPETRERIELRSRASLGEYLLARMQGRMVQGAEAELAEAAKIQDGAIPIELFDVPDQTEQRADTATGAPSTTGVNLDPIRPMLFANSIAPRLGIAMPRTMSGTFATATISTKLTAGAKAKAAAQESSEAGFTVATTTPKRVSGRLSITLEDVALIGTGNFESQLRQHLGLVMSDALDNFAINGVRADGATGDAGAQPKGIFAALTDPTAAPTEVADFDAFVSAFADGIDGLWASTVKDVAIVAGTDTYRLSAKTFRDRVIDETNKGAASLGDMSFASYAEQHLGGWWTNERMPAAASNVEQAVLHRKGRMGVRTATCPHWNILSIDDIFSGSAAGIRHFTMHVLLGDVILVQPDAYAQVAFKVA